MVRRLAARRASWLGHPARRAARRRGRRRRRGSPRSGRRTDRRRGTCRSPTPSDSCRPTHTGAASPTAPRSARPEAARAAGPAMTMWWSGRPQLPARTTESERPPAEAPVGCRASMVRRTQPQLRPRGQPRPLLPLAASRSA